MWKGESLARDYNIYVFHGTDGDDWDRDGKQTIQELERMASYVSRVGITIVHHSYAANKDTEVAKYLKASGVLRKHDNLIKMDVMGEDADDSRIIQGIKNLIS